MRGDTSRLPLIVAALVGGLPPKMKKLMIVFVLAATGLLLAACGGGGTSEEPTTTAPTSIATTVDQPTQTPAATAESKYDEAWARKQVEPLQEEVYQAILDKNWSKTYDWYSDEAREGCSRSTYVGKMAGNMLMLAAFGINDDYFKAMLQDIKNGTLVITFQEITKDRITYTMEGSDAPTTIVREKGKWAGADELLGQDCSSLDMEAAEAETPTATTVVETPVPTIEQITATPPPAAGLSRGNALPLGQTAVVPPGWEVTVLGVDEDAWPEVQAENQFNDPPEQGYRMVMVTLRVTNIQTKDEAVRISAGDFELVGSRNQVYKTYERSCGVTPNSLEAELFPQGTADGTVCLQAGIDETGLLLIASPSWDEEDQRYFALQ